MAVRSFLGADTVDEWRPRSAACNWGDAGSDSGPSGGIGSDYAASPGAYDYGPSDSWTSYDTSNFDAGNAFNDAFNSGNQGFDNAGSWASYSGADAPFGASVTSPGESLFGGGGFSPDSGFVNFNEGQSFPGDYNTTVNFDSGNYWGAAPVADLGNYFAGGFSGGPAGWAGEFGAYGPMSGPSMGYANYAGNVTAPGLVGGFMDAGPFGMFGNQPGDYGVPGAFNGSIGPDPRGPGQEMDQGGRDFDLSSQGLNYGRSDLSINQMPLGRGLDPYDPGNTFMSEQIAGRGPGIDPYVGTQHPEALYTDPSVPVSPANPLDPVGPPVQSPTTNPFSITPGNFFAPNTAEAQTVGHPSLTPALQYLADQMNTNYGPYQIANGFNNNFNPNNATPSLDYVAPRGDISPTNDFMAASPFGPANQFSGQPSLANENTTPGKGDRGGDYSVMAFNDRGADLSNPQAPGALPGWAPGTVTGGIPGIQSAPGFVGQPGWAAPGLTAGLPASMFGYDTISNQEAKGDRGAVYDQSRESLNDAGRALLSDAFQSRAGQDILQDQRELQDQQRAPWTIAQLDLMPATPWAYPTADPRSVEARGPQNIEYEGQNQNMGRPNSYPTLAEFLGPGRGQSQNIYAPSRDSTLQVTVPGRVSESSRGASSPFGGGRGTQSQMDALLAQARTAPTQAARIAALDALNGIISATYGRGPNQSVGRGPYGGDPDPFIAQMLRMGR